MNQVNINVNYIVAGRPGVIEAIPDTSMGAHLPICCDCGPLVGFSICANCRRHVDIYVHREPGIPPDITKNALKMIGKAVAEGGHGPA
jgi:hypothetical protein